MEAKTTEFLDYVLTMNNLLIVVAVWTLIGAVHRMFPELRAGGTLGKVVWARALPLLPIVLTSVAVWLPGAGPEEITLANRIFLGIILGAFTANAHKILGQTVLGKDDGARRGDAPEA